MTRELWPCCRCGGSGSRNIGTSGYCGAHLAELYAAFEPLVFALHGVGLPCGQVRPDLGPALEDLRCVACGAGWVGVAGESCAWCERSKAVLTAHQHDLALQPPEVLTESTLTAWGEQLRLAVAAEVVTRAEAERVWRRAVQLVA